MIEDFPVTTVISHFSQKTTFVYVEVTKNASRYSDYSRGQVTLLWSDKVSLESRCRCFGQQSTIYTMRMKIN